MKISLNWLSDFINLQTKDIQQIKNIITTNTAEVETVETSGENLDNMVVGQILKLTKHPNADKLKLCQTDIGGETVQIVCGGSNLKEGRLVAVGKPGAQVRWHGEGDLIELSKAKIRGEESIGMICTSSEIGLAELFPMKEKTEIMDLRHLDLTVGEDLRTALGLDDVVLNIDNHALTNRSDLFSQLGFAREFVANELADFKSARTVGEKLDLPDQDLPINISFDDSDICSRYCAVTVDNLTVKESPAYIKKRLQACGIRPINNIVDVTNYVMLEYGTPCHAFDLETIDGTNVRHRKSKKGEKITTLDGIERELPENAIIIEDEKKIFDLAGIMGGENSEIRPSTKTVWLHVAIYNKVLIRRAMVALGHRTDASTIFEKGVPPHFGYEATLRALELLLESCPEAKITSRVLDHKHYHEEERVIELSKDFINRLTGVEISDEEIQKTLRNLGFQVVTHDNGRYDVTVPGFRVSDIHGPADIVEEIVRIFGFNQIPAVLPTSPVKVGVKPKNKVLAQKIRQILASLGLSEICTYSFLGQDLLKKIGDEVDQSYLRVSNFITEDISIMRQSLLPRVLETTALNLKYQNEVNLFELSRVFIKKEKNIVENTMLCGVLCAEHANFRDTKELVAELGKRLRLDFKYRYFEKEIFSFIHPGRQAEILIGDQAVGFVAELHPQVKANFGINLPICILEIDVDSLLNFYTGIPQYQKIQRLPTIKLDLSVLINKNDLAEKYTAVINNVNSSLVRQVRIIDEYQGEKIPQDKRNITFSITYGAPDRTLKEEEAQEIHSTIIDKLANSGAVLRS